MTRDRSLRKRQRGQLVAQTRSWAPQAQLRQLVRIHSARKQRWRKNFCCRRIAAGPRAPNLKIHENFWKLKTCASTTFDMKVSHACSKSVKRFRRLQPCPGIARGLHCSDTPTPNRQAINMKDGNGWIACRTTDQKTEYLSNATASQPNR